MGSRYFAKVRPVINFLLFYNQNKPYASLVESYKKLDGNNQFEGYGVELIKELANKLGFNYTLINGGNDYGSYNKTTNTSTGMLKEIREGVSTTMRKKTGYHEI